MPPSNRIHIGTSGWNYKHWKGPFYPEDIPAKQWFDHYAKNFHTVEINRTFYRLPEPETFEQWRRNALEGFFFSLKASRYITHVKKLKDPLQPVSDFMERAGRLKEKLGPVLFQLPPRWKCNPERLGAFLKVLPENRRYALEFRDDTWWNSEVYEILRSHNVAFCTFHLAGVLSPLEITADFAYIRLHGPGDAYQGSYDENSLSQWADQIGQWRAEGLEIYIYFDNDEKGHAPRDALRLLAKVNSRNSQAPHP